jgi:excinuclease ABC subunit C
MVVFEGGTPKKAHYRKFKVRSAGPDDVSSISEVLERRMARYVDQADLSPHDAERDGSFATLPGLIVIDGGKGQLSAGMRALAPLAERGTTVIGLAKRIEQVFLPGRPDPVPIPRDSEALRLLQRVRDEAHRFAIEFHRERRDKAMRHSVFDELHGVGPVRKRALLSHFGSPDRFLRASREELEAVPGIPGKLARDIHKQLHRAG